MPADARDALRKAPRPPRPPPPAPPNRVPAATQAQWAVAATVAGLPALGLAVAAATAGSNGLHAVVLALWGLTEYPVPGWVALGVAGCAAAWHVRRIGDRRRAALLANGALAVAGALYAWRVTTDMGEGGWWLWPLVGVHFAALCVPPLAVIAAAIEQWDHWGKSVHWTTWWQARRSNRPAGVAACATLQLTVGSVLAVAGLWSLTSVLRVHTALGGDAGAFVLHAVLWLVLPGVAQLAAGFVLLGRDPYTWEVARAANGLWLSLSPLYVVWIARGLLPLWPALAALVALFTAPSAVAYLTLRGPAAKSWFRVDGPASRVRRPRGPRA